eukprot:442552-Karenia_brevis.AAC.1
MEYHPDSGSVLERYRAQSCMDRHDRTPFRRSPSHKANRNKKDPSSTSANPTPRMMPSLEPDGPIPKNVISGKKVEAGHISLDLGRCGKGQMGRALGNHRSHGIGNNNGLYGYPC